MSGSLSAIAAIAAGASYSGAVLLRAPRRIGTVVPQVVVDEMATDELMITDHPVEIGAAISDHAFKRPAVIVMRCGWSNSSPLSGGPSTSYVRQVYEELLKLQGSRVPFDVVTGKRLYKKMLIAGLTMQNNAALENSLMVVCQMREVILVSTSTAQVPASSQAQPQNTAAPSNTGAIAPSGVPNSAVNYIYDGGGRNTLPGTTGASAFA